MGRQAVITLYYVHKERHMMSKTAAEIWLIGLCYKFIKDTIEGLKREIGDPMKRVSENPEAEVKAFFTALRGAVDLYEEDALRAVKKTQQK